MVSSIRHDVVVLGTGAAGLTAALAAACEGASVGIYDKASLVGGTTAISGGVVWVPLNNHARDAGVEDSREQALAYLDSLSLGRMDPELAAVFVNEGAATIQWLEEVTAMRFAVLSGFPDYQPENPGGLPGGGRSLDPGLFSFQRLGTWADRVTRSRRSAHLTISDTTLGGGTGFLDEQTQRYREENDLRGCGSALVGPLLAALLDLGVEPVLDAPVEDLILDSGRVIGARMLIDGAESDVWANRGVVLATGGFEWNQALVNEFLRGPMTAPTSVPSNTGDGLLIAMRAGARLANMGQAWWVPAARIPGDLAFGEQRSHLVNRERTLPGSIMINKRGRRFTNEASNYNSLGGAFHQMDAAHFGYANLPAWLIFDEHYAREYGGFGAAPGQSLADWIPRHQDLNTLATTIGVDPSGLRAAVGRWNDQVAAGIDDDFGRGESAYDLWSGDGRYRYTKASTLGPIDEPPYYAVQIHSGALGTSGGPRTDSKARVLDTRSTPIPGLYAAGNVAAAPTAMAYGGGGGTLGPILVFARIAGSAAASGSVA